MGFFALVCRSCYFFGSVLLDMIGNPHWGFLGRSGLNGVRSGNDL